MPAHVAILGTRGYPSYYGGFETLLRNLVPYLAHEGWRVDVYNRRDTARLAPHELPPFVRQIATPCLETKALSTLTHGGTSAAHAAVSRPDVALIMNVANGYWLPVLRAAGVPTVVNVDGIEWERAKWGRAAKSIFHAGASLTARFADDLVVDSIAIGRRWEADFGRTGAFIPYGGRTDFARAAPPGLVPRQYALCVARFVPENSVTEFISAAEMVARSHDVVIVGSSGYGGALDDAVADLESRLPRVQWMGHVRDDDALFALWHHAGAYFHGHSVGGTNPALVQAMACGAPIVARDTIFNREVLGEAALFTPPDPGQIANAVLTILEDPALQARLSDQARERQQAHYTWDDVCVRYAGLLESVADRRPSRRRSTPPEKLRGDGFRRAV